MTKQVLVVRKDLNMRKGKIAAQAAHASLKVFFDRMKRLGAFADTEFSPITVKYTLDISQEMDEWVAGIFTKICVSVDSEAELLDVFEKAKAAELPCSLIQDAGLTEFGKVPTYTVVAVGPASAEKIDKITGHLNLL